MFEDVQAETYKQRDDYLFLDMKEILYDDVACPFPHVIYFAELSLHNCK